MMDGGMGNEPSNDDDFLLGLRGRTLENGVPLSGLDIVFVGADVDGAVLFKHVEFVKCVQGWCVFDVAG